MSISTRLSTATSRQQRTSSDGARNPDRELGRWGGIAGLGGVALLIGTFVVVGTMGLPDASDAETLTDFADIEAGRIAEHFLYLGALVLFALHVTVLYRFLRPTHPAAALFGAAIAEFGLVIMAASSLLHVSTSPLADLYTDPATPQADLQAIEYAWHGAQSVFDTMLTTGVLLVPIGIILLGVAMSTAAAFGSRLSIAAMALGAIGVIGAVIAVIDPGSTFAAASVFAIAIFHLVVGWRTFAIGNELTIDLTSAPPTPVE